METTREREERYLAEAEAFLKEKGFDVYVKNFFASEDAKKLIQASYLELVAYITELKANVPKELNERVEELQKVFADHEEIYRSDAEANFKIRLHTSCVLIPNQVLEVLIKGGHFEKVFETQKETMMKDLIEILQILKENLIMAFLEKLYEDTLED